MRITFDVEPKPVVALSLAAADDFLCDRNEIAPALWRMLERTLREGRVNRGAIESELFEAAFAARTRPSTLGR